MSAEPTSRAVDGVRAVAPLGIGSFLFAASFGVLAGPAGLSVVAAVFMSATTFAGSAQLAAAGTLEAGGGALAAVAAAVLLNARYLPMGIAAADAFEGGPLRRFAEAQLIVDESWAIAGRGGRFQRPVLVGAGLLLYVCWVSGTAVGAIFGEALGDPEAIGLDAAFPALFLALLWPYLRTPAGRRGALLAAVVTLALIPVAPPGVPIVAASVVCLLGLRR